MSSIIHAPFASRNYSENDHVQKIVTVSSAEFISNLGTILRDKVAGLIESDGHGMITVTTIEGRR